MLLLGSGNISAEARTLIIHTLTCFHMLEINKPPFTKVRDILESFSYARQTNHTSQKPGQLNPFIDTFTCQCHRKHLFKCKLLNLLVNDRPRNRICHNIPKISLKQESKRTVTQEPVEISLQTSFLLQISRLFKYRSPPICRWPNCSQTPFTTITQIASIFLGYSEVQWSMLAQESHRSILQISHGLHNNWRPSIPSIKKPSDSRHLERFVQPFHS